MDVPEVNFFHTDKDENGVARPRGELYLSCLLYTSDAADERSSVDLGGRRIIKKTKQENKNKSHNSHKQVQKDSYIEITIRNCLCNGYTEA